MSLFVTLWPIVDGLAEAVAGVRADGDGWRWTSPDKWHLTLAFLGGGPDSPALRSRLARAVAGVEPFELRLAGAGCFPDRGEPKVLWTGVDGNLGPLAGRVRAAADGTDLDSRPFRAHLTLAYAKGAPTRTAVDALAAYRGKVFRPHAVHLVRSAAGRYTELERWPLGSAAWS